MVSPLAQGKSGNKYSTPNSEWEILDTFVSGQEIEIDAVMVYYHWVRQDISHAHRASSGISSLDVPDARRPCFVRLACSPETVGYAVVARGVS